MSGRRWTDSCKEITSLKNPSEVCLNEIYTTTWLRGCCIILLFCFHSLFSAFPNFSYFSWIGNKRALVLPFCPSIQMWINPHTRSFKHFNKYHFLQTSHPPLLRQYQASTPVPFLWSFPVLCVAMLSTELPFTILYVAHRFLPIC